MTITDQISHVTYVGNGSQIQFYFDFPFIADSDIHVYQDNVEADSGAWELYPNKDKVGGYALFVDPPANGVEVMIRREVPATQESEYPTYGPFQAKSHEAALDKLTMLIQQLNAGIETLVSQSFTYRGEWMAGTVYQTMNVVTYQNNFYTSRYNFTSGTLFNASNWNLVIDMAGFLEDIEEAKNAAEQAGVSEANAAVSAQNAANCAQAAHDSAVGVDNWATEAKNWANYPENTPVPEGNGTEMSAKHWAQQAEVGASGGIVGVNGSAPINVENIGGDPKEKLVSIEMSGPGFVPVSSGANGQHLAKDSGQPEGVRWEDPPEGVPSGGTAGQVLTKGTTGAGWQDPAALNIPDGVMVVGGLHGLDYSRAGDNLITIQPGACWNHDHTIPLALTAEYSLDVTSQPNSHPVNLFLVRAANDPEDIRVIPATTSDIDLVTDPVYQFWDAKRWMGFIPKLSGTLAHFLQVGDFMKFLVADEMVLAYNISTTWVTVDHSPFLPIDRIEAVSYGAGSVYQTLPTLMVASDGIERGESFEVSFRITLGAYYSTQWGDFSDGMMGHHAFNPSRYFKYDGPGHCKLLLSSVKMKR